MLYVSNITEVIELKGFICLGDAGGKRVPSCNTSVLRVRLNTRLGSRRKERREKRRVILTGPFSHSVTKYVFNTLS